MPKIIGTEKICLKHAVINDKDIPSAVLRIRSCGKIKGRDLYGFFVTNEEFTDKLAQIYCSNGIYDIPILKYEAGESIVLAISCSGNTKSNNSESSEFFKKIEDGAFIKQSEINIKKQLIILQIPIRKIMFWHRLGWAFTK